MKITVVGLGYVGLANALLLAQHNEVTGVDTNLQRIDQLSRGESPLKDAEIEDSLKTTPIAWSDSLESVRDAKLMVIATPTNFDETTGNFDTSSIDTVVHNALELNHDLHILIKSTIPIGYIHNLRAQTKSDTIAFSPEFLREGKALYDNLYPSRIIIGDTAEWAQGVAQLFAAAALNTPPVLLTDPNEAEAIKLFSNTYLAMRVAYFNELDTFCATHQLDTKTVIAGTGLDPRIGDWHNNPSFGYGGYCLPKDSKQLLASYGDIPNDLIAAIVTSNQTRKDFIVDDIMKKHPKTVGIYRLTMKTGSDNFRMSAVLDIMTALRQRGVEVIVYEPSTEATEFDGFAIVDFATLATADVIAANRFDPQLEPLQSKVYTRDVFSRD